MGDTSGFFISERPRSMDCIVECVPNFSEGRDPATIQALIDALASVPRVRLLDHTSD